MSGSEGQAMKRTSIPDDSHLCESCKLRPHTLCSCVCSECHAWFMVWVFNPWQDIVEFRDAQKGG